MSTLNVDALVGNTSANAITVRGEGSATTSLQQGLAKAWAEIDMTGTAANNDSFNIASFTDAGTGAFNLVISSDMANANYCFSVGFNNQASDVSGFLKSVGASSKTAGQINMGKKENGSAVDCDVNCTTIHGDLA